MARADLSTMLGKLEDSTTSSAPAEIQTPVETAPKSSAAKTAPKGATRKARESGYRSFERKEARLRADQYTKLTEEARRLNRVRTSGSRITENTLIRVAIDLLLDRSEQLAGETEYELRKSVSL